MRKLIFIIAVCMLYHNAYGAGEHGSPPCPAGKCWQLGNSANCVVCPDNTYQDSDSYIWYECKPCPAGTITIGDTAADHDSIDDCVAVSVSCMPGYYLPANSTSCAQCPRNSYCVGGEFDATSTDVGIMPCPNNTYSPAGSDSSDDCGRILHIGEYILYLRTAKLTTPSLNVQIGNTVYYGDMFPA